MLSPSIIRILIAHDHPILRDGLRTMISSDTGLAVIGEACNGDEAVNMYQVSRPDILLVDLKMPDITGIDVIMAVRTIDVDAKIIVLTTYMGYVQALRCLRAGARGYLLKAALRSQLLNTIRAVYAGDFRVPDDVASEIAMHASEDVLTEVELRILKLISMGCHNRVIAERLETSEFTVKNSIKAILTKLGAKDRTHAVTLAVRHGYFDL